MRIAAVIPTYNAAPFIEDTLESVFSQTRLPDELIIADDASTDGTLEILESWIHRKSIPVKLIRCPENTGGPAAPLNDAIAETTCDWIATLDHDDRWRRNWVQSAWSAAVACHVELVLGRVAVQNEQAQADLDHRFLQLHSTTDNNVLNRDVAYRELVPALSYGVTCSNMFFSRGLAQSIPFDANLHRCCDYRFLQQVTESHEIALIDRISCDWQATPQSLFQRGAMDALDRELLYVYDRFDPSKLTKTLRRQLQSKCHKLAYDLAHAARERGDYDQALSDYRRSMKYGGSWIRAGKAIAKTLWLKHRRRK